MDPSFMDMICGVLAVVVFLGIAWAVTTRRGWMAFLLGMLPMVLFIILAYYEGGWERTLYVLSPRYQYWSFLFGDPALSLALWVAAKGERMAAWWWAYVVAPICGVVSALAFHFLVNKPGYEAAGNPTAVDTPTFRLHAVMTWPVLFTAVVAFLVPYLWFRSRRTIAVVLLSSVWLVGSNLDGVRNSPEYKGRLGTDLTKVHLPVGVIEQRHPGVGTN